jgi:hypothetical protein
MPRNRRSETEQANFKQRDESIEIGQPDPELQEGVAGPGRIAVYAIVGLFILGLVLYGLNQPGQETVAGQQGTPGAPASSPQTAPLQNDASKSGGAATTTGAASQESKPQPANQPGNAQNQPQPPAQGNASPDAGKAQ